MSLTNTRKAYGSVTKCLHWLMALAIIGLLISGNFMSGIKNQEWMILCINLHKSFGVSIFILAVFRIAWALSNTHPDFPHNMRKTERVLSKIVQGLLYTLLIIMPLTGWLMTSYKGYPISFFGLFYFPTAPVVMDREIGHFWHEIHELVGWTLLALFSGHGLAALKHHFINKDNVLKTMLPGRYD